MSSDGVSDIKLLVTAMWVKMGATFIFIITSANRPVLIIMSLLNSHWTAEEAGMKHVASPQICSWSNNNFLDQKLSIFNFILTRNIYALGYENINNG